LDSEFRNLNSKGAIGFEQGTVANNNNNVWATNCVFVSNYSSYGSLYANGLPGRFTLTLCTFQSNSVPNSTLHDTYASTVIHNDAGGTKVVQIDRCRFLDNTNGVMFGFSNVNPFSMKNSLFVGNKTTYYLMGGYNWGGGSIVNCTFVGNRGTLQKNGADGNSILFRNNLVSLHETDLGGSNAGNSLALQTNLFWQTSLGTYLTGSSSGIITNMDPRLLPSYLPGQGSPAVNAGNNAWMTDPYDLAGNRRILRKIVDLGAFEAVEAGSAFIMR
jgi:hypothetical protein